MKKLRCIFYSLCLFMTISKAQITLEHVFDSTTATNFYCTDIGNNDFKYVFLNASSNSFSLFNMDMSPYLTNISIPFLNDSIKNGFSVIYISKALFDCDTTTIEYMFEYVYDVNHTFRIARTDGTVLLQVDSANSPFIYGGLYGGSKEIRPIIKTSAGTKLFVQRYNNNVPEILVYSICGDLPTQITFNENNSFVKVFPNPSTGMINFQINTPNNQETFDIEIFDALGKKAKNNQSSFFNGTNFLDVSAFSPGIYYYSIGSKSKVYHNGKFIISK